MTPKLFKNTEYVFEVLLFLSAFFLKDGYAKAMIHKKIKSDEK